MNKSSIYSIRDGSNWEDISSQYNISRTNYNKLDENIVHKICQMIKNEISLTSISDKLNIKYSTIGSIKQKVSWKEISDQYF